MKQIDFFKIDDKAYGGVLLNTRKGRSKPRPLDTKNTMHLVLRSSRAKEEWSFKRYQNTAKINQIIQKFSHKYGVRIISLANVGNHLHFQIKLANRYAYKPFIRATTAAIAMAVTGASRWSPLKKEFKDRFWDYRPFTRVVHGLRAFLNLKDYIQINKLEVIGFQREVARFTIAWESAKELDST